MENQRLAGWELVDQRMPTRQEIESCLGYFFVWGPELRNRIAIARLSEDDKSFLVDGGGVLAATHWMRVTLPPPPAI